MKPLKNDLLAAAFALCGLVLAACGSGAGSGSAIKVDTVINPQDNTNTPKMDSTLPKGAAGMDTVAGGKSNSSGIKDTGKHKHNPPQSSHLKYISTISPASLPINNYFGN